MVYIIRISVTGRLSSVRPWRIIQLELNLNIHGADSSLQYFLHLNLYLDMFIILLLLIDTKQSQSSNTRMCWRGSSGSR